jgi:hypothetical protein
MHNVFRFPGGDETLMCVNPCDAGGVQDLQAAYGTEDIVASQEGLAVDYNTEDTVPATMFIFSKPEASHCMIVVMLDEPTGKTRVNGEWIPTSETYILRRPIGGDFVAQTLRQITGGGLRNMMNASGCFR